MSDFESQIKSLGYTSTKQYMNKVLIPSLQASELTEKYFADAKKTFKTHINQVKLVSFNVKIRQQLKKH